MHGFSTLFTFSNVGAALLGAVLGLVVGAMPGIGSLAGVALLLPLTYKFNPTTAIIMLGALYYSNMYGGSLQRNPVKYSGRLTGHLHGHGRLPNGIQKKASRTGAVSQPIWPPLSEEPSASSS